MIWTMQLRSEHSIRGLVHQLVLLFAHLNLLVPLQLVAGYESTTNLTDLRPNHCDPKLAGLHELIAESLGKISTCSGCPLTVLLLLDAVSCHGPGSAAALLFSHRGGKRSRTRSSFVAGNGGCSLSCQCLNIYVILAVSRCTVPADIRQRPAAGFIWTAIQHQSALHHPARDYRATRRAQLGRRGTGFELQLADPCDRLRAPRKTRVRAHTRSRPRQSQTYSGPIFCPVSCARAGSNRATGYPPSRRCVGAARRAARR